MRIPFAIWSGVLAVLVFAGLTAYDMMNFGTLELDIGRALIIGGVWIVLVILMGFAGQIRRAATSRPVDVPNDVAREISRHPED